MATIVTRAGKGSPLTNAEVDANFTNLNNDVLSRLLASSNLGDLTNAATARANLGLGNVENKSSATIRGELTSGNVTTALGFTPYNSTNPNGYITSSALSSYLPLAGGAVSGVLSLTGSNATPLEVVRTGSNANANMRFSNTASTTFFGIGAQSGELRVGTAVDIYNTGNIVLHTGNVKTVNGNSIQGSGNIQIDSGVTTFNSRAGAVTLSSGDVTGALGFTPYNSTNPSGYITSSGSISGSAGSLNLGGHTISSSSWAGGGGYHGYTHNGGNFRFGFSSTGGVVDVYADGNFYATDSSHLVLHAGNFSSYALPVGGGTVSSLNISGSVLSLGSVNVMSRGGTWTEIRDPSGATKFWAGNDASIYMNASNYFFRTNGSESSQLTISGGSLVASGNVTANSDERLKKDWAELPIDFIERLATVKSGTYTRIDGGERQAGASAQDMKKLLTEVVIVAPDEQGTLSLAYGNAALVSAIQLAIRVVAQDKRIAALEALVLGDN